MQATKVKQFRARIVAGRFGIAVVAIGTLAIGLVAANALYDVNSGDDGGTDATAQSATRAVQSDRLRFLEANTVMIEFDSQSQPFAKTLFLEWNTILPGTDATDASSSSTTRSEFVVTRH